jgi:aspartate kinase
MDFPIIRRERRPENGNHQPNGTSTNGTIENRISHKPERDLPGGANWIVQKFGGTSVGKFSVKIAEDIILYVR